MSEENTAPVATDGEDTGAVLAALQGDKTYLKDAPETPAVEAAPKEDEPGDNAAAAPAEPEAEKPKPKQTAQERIDELTRARREAERDVEYWKAKATQTPTQQPAHEAQHTAETGDGRPDPNDYEGGRQNDQYIEDVTDWKAEQAVERRLAQREQRTHFQTVVENYHTRTKALFPDGKPAGLEAFERIEVVPESVNEIVGASEVGPKIAAHLGENPEELARLFRLSPIMQARELTQLEQRLTTPAEAAKPTPKTATDAPEPPPQARGAGGTFKVAPDTNDFAAFERQYRPGG